MIDFNNRHLFAPFIHPESGVTFHILTRKVAPVQKGFYFVNDSMSADGRFLWFCCAWPPSLKKTLAGGCGDRQSVVVIGTASGRTLFACPFMRLHANSQSEHHTRIMWQVRRA